MYVQNARCNWLHICNIRCNCPHSTFCSRTKKASASVLRPGTMVSAVGFISANLLQLHCGSTSPGIYWIFSFNSLYWQAAAFPSAAWDPRGKPAHRWPSGRRAGHLTKPAALTPPWLLPAEESTLPTEQPWQGRSSEETAVDLVGLAWLEGQPDDGLRGKSWPLIAG